MADDFEFRLKSLEDRETILYEFMEKLRQDHEDSLKRFEQFEKHIEQNEKRMEQNEKRIEQNEWVIASVVENQRSMIETLGKISRTVDTLVETQGMLIQIIDRVEQKVDDLVKPGKNGHT